VTHISYIVKHRSKVPENILEIFKTFPVNGILFRIEKSLCLVVSVMHSKEYKVNQF
jgi:hypothetical protein